VPSTAYLLDNVRELDRLRLQARVWEPAGAELLARIGPAAAPGLRVLDAGCGAMGWLGVLADWVGPTGTVVGTDIAPNLLEAASGFVAERGLENVELVEDDLFASRLAPGSFDLVHARFQLAPIGREAGQLAAYRRWLRPGGWLVLEDPDAASWRLQPQASATARLIALVLEAFRAGGGDFDSGRRLPDLLRACGVAEPGVMATIRALEPGHPYLRLPLQFATSLEPRLVPALIGSDELAALRDAVEAELAAPGAWGTSFTLVGAWGRVP
jgi:ubiquinone/menaquinone biosynthesis C-methylase UbiE